MVIFFLRSVMLNWIGSFHICFFGGLISNVSLAMDVANAVWLVFRPDAARRVVT